MAFSFSLSVNSGAEDGRPYTVINISDENGLVCKEEILAYDRSFIFATLPAVRYRRLRIKFWLLRR